MSSSRASLLSARSSSSLNNRSVDYDFVSIEEECPPSVDGENKPPCFSLLQQFYDELMIPTFPLEEERDDIQDWFECFRLQMKQRHQLQEQKQQEDIKQALTEVIQEEGIAEAVHKLSNTTISDNAEFDGPAMDVILMILEEGSGDDDDSRNDVTANATGRFPRRRSSRIRMSMYGGLYAPKSDQNAKLYSDGNKPIIIGGAAVEYYKKSRVGLLSYVVLRDEFRGCGLARYLHEEALSRLENLANVYGTSYQKERNRNFESIPLLQAVFAETNTAEAGDVSPEQSLLRHNSLYNLGYRLVSFPYAQPPLTTEDVDGSFDEILLLTYFPFDEQTVRTACNLGEYALRYCQWFSQQTSDDEGPEIASAAQAQMDVSIPFHYVEDFYQSVFGYDSNDDSDAKKVENGVLPDYRTAKYYKLVHWFTCQKKGDGRGRVNVSLGRPPWNDCKEILGNEFEKSLALDEAED